MKPKKQCNHSSCRTLIPFDEQYCEKHIHLKQESNQKYDFIRNREDREYRKIYQSGRWKKLRHQALVRDGFMCQKCLDIGIYNRAEVVDHIIELKDDISRAFDMDNLQSLCVKHHNEKTLEEKKRRTRESKSPVRKNTLL
ncbi:HNH endonuclease [Abyssicoccus albus]|uniref:HNH endonuclease n=1 Tax=Abyssicoccus albus TaxID=1817405 RepID=UPI00097E31F3|nr:HNH endonuclease [Abyssicoccus albus]AQL56425.1 hypothetical protein BVH56_05575 [Abyssicoccus albus]